VIAFAVSVLPAYSQNYLWPRKGFQVSTLGALNVGIYEGATTFAELKNHGNFGLGTFEGLDGELVFLNGTAYQIQADGVVHAVPDTAKTPFSVVSFFQKERSLRLTGSKTYQELQQGINQQLPIQNLPYAIRIQGTFPYLKVRSVPKQTPPYPPLSTVVSQQQRIFELRNVQGTLVGFRLPPYFKTINVAGYHFHFITRDRKTGGHVLDGEFRNAVADVQTLRDWEMALPDNKAFEQASLE
jgi:acetolactate decarboxylase